MVKWPTLNPLLLALGLVFLVGLAASKTPNQGGEAKLGLLSSLFKGNFKRILILLDSSGSIPISVWHQDIKTLCKGLVAELPNEIALWSFSSTTVVEQDFTSDRLLLNSAIDRAKHQRGSTNLALAYQQAAVSFDGIESSSAIVLITDGVPDDLDRAISFKPNVEIVVAGYGSINLENVQKLASRRELGFSFPDARSIINHIKLKEMKPNVMIKDITLLNTDDHYSSLQDINALNIRFTVVNTMVDDEIPANTTIWFHSTSDIVMKSRFILRDPIQPEEKRTFSYSIALNKITSALDLPCSIAFELGTTGSSRRIDLFAQYSAFEVSLSLLRGLFLGWKFITWPPSLGPSGPYRILHLGPPGTGKSTKINEVFLALDSEKDHLPTVAQACNGAAHCTLSANMHKLSVRQGDRYRELSVEWMDSWGIDNDNMIGDSLEMFIDGLMEGKEMSREFNRSQEDNATKPADVVILFISINGASDEVVDKMKTVISLSQKRGIEALLAITHIDQVPEDQRERKKEILGELFGLRREKVILTMHERGGHRSCEVEKSTLDLFLRTMKAIDDSRLNKLRSMERSHCQNLESPACLEVRRILYGEEPSPAWTQIGGALVALLAVGIGLYYSPLRQARNQGNSAQHKPATTKVVEEGEGAATLSSEKSTSALKQDDQSSEKPTANISEKPPSTSENITANTTEQVRIKTESSEQPTVNTSEKAPSESNCPEKQMDPS